MTKIIVLHNNKNIGDRNQSLGIADELQQLLIKQGEKEVTVEVTDNVIQFDNSTLMETLARKEKLVLISAGDFGLATLPAYHHFPHVKTIWSGHHIFEQFKTLNDLPDVISLPAHTQEEAKEVAALSAKSIIFTDGVAHNVTEQSIHGDMQKFQNAGRDLPDCSQSAVVILPGDAPDETGKLKAFTKSDAQALAEQIFAQTQQLGLNRLIVTNGPRTGKHLAPETAHRDNTVDGVTQAFCDKWQQLSGTQAELHDFQFHNLPSAYKPLLHSLQQNSESVIFVPGESTSMVTECIGTLPRSQVFICEVNCMSSTHHHHLETVKRQGGIQVLRSNGQLECGPSIEHYETTAAAKHIAQASLTMPVKKKTNLKKMAQYSECTLAFRQYELAAQRKHQNSEQATSSLKG